MFLERLFVSMLIAVEGIDGAGKSTVRGHLTEYFETDNVVTTREPYDDEWLGQKVRENIADDETHPLSVFFIFMADHVYHYASIVKPALEDNIVLSDRYIDSRYAYQGYAIDKFVEGDTLEYIKTVQESQWDIDQSNPDVQMILSDAREAIPEYVLEELPVIGQYFYGLALNIEVLPVFNGSDQLSDPESDLVGFTMQQDQDPEWSQLPDQTLLIDVSIPTAFERQGEEKDRFEKEEFLTEVRENYLELSERDPDRFTVIDGEQSKADVRETVIDYISGVSE